MNVPKDGAELQDGDPPTLAVGEHIVGGECLQSPNAQIRFCLNSDGNLCLYQSGRDGVLWASDTSMTSQGMGMNFSLSLTETGSLRILPQANTWRPVLSWQLLSDGDNHPSAILEARDDCNVVLQEEGRIFWQTGTTCDDPYASAGVTGSLIAAPLVLFMILLTRFCRMRRKGHLRLHSATSSTIEDPRALVAELRHWDDTIPYVSGMMLALLCTLYALGKHVRSSVLEAYNLVPVVPGNATLYLLGLLGLVGKSHFRSPWREFVFRFCRIALGFVAIIILMIANPYVQRELWKTMPEFSHLGIPPKCSNSMTVSINGESECRFQHETANVITLAVIMVSCMFFTAGEGAILSVLVWCAFAAEEVTFVGVFDVITNLPRLASCGITLWGKRTLEKTQWRLAIEMQERQRDMIKERVLRYEAEHHAVKQIVGGASNVDNLGDCTSEAPTEKTTLTAKFFRRLLGDNRPPGDVLADLTALGKQEKWLIEDSTLESPQGPKYLLGRGGFGDVRIGFWHGTRVALKTASTCTAHITKTRIEDLENIIDELHVLRHLRHPNIALCFGAVIKPKDRSIILVMELVDGMTLWDFVEAQPPTRDRSPTAPPSDVPIRLDLMHSILSGLRYLHESEPAVVHSDLKPSNVMVSSSRHPSLDVKLLDFGLSRMQSRSARFSGGTRSWMAPEVMLALLQAQAQDGWALIDDQSGEIVPDKSLGRACRTSADMYSCGLVMYFVWTGTPPELPQVSSDKGTIGQRQLEWPEGGVHDRLRDVTQSLLRMDPSFRPAAAHVWDQLRTLKQLACSTDLRVGLRKIAVGAEASAIAAADMARHTPITKTCDGASYEVGLDIMHPDVKSSTVSCSNTPMKVFAAGVPDAALEVSPSEGPGIGLSESPEPSERRVNLVRLEL